MVKFSVPEIYLGQDWLDDIKLVAGQYVVKVTASKVTQSEIVTFE